MALTHKEKNWHTVWVIVPAYNEAKYIAHVLEKIRRITDNIVVVDDGSKDGTGSVAKKVVRDVLIHSVNLGKGAALKTGAEYAFSNLSASAVVFIDSDDQHDPAELPAFFNALTTSDVVFGARNLSKAMPFMRGALNKVASVLIWLLFGVYIPDIPCGYKAMTKKAYTKLVWQSRDYAVEMELAARAAKAKIPFRVIPIKTIYHDFDRGMTFLDTIKMIFQLISWRISL